MSCLQSYFVVIFASVLLLFIGHAPFDNACVAYTEVAEKESDHVVLNVLSAEPRSCEYLGEKIIFRGPGSTAGEGRDFSCKQKVEWLDNSAGFSNYELGMKVNFDYKRVNKYGLNGLVCDVEWTEIR